MNKARLEAVWQASEAVSASSSLAANGLGTPLELVERIEANIGSVVEAHDELLPRLGATTEPGSADRLLYDALLTSERGDGVGKICLRTFDLLESEGVALTEVNEEVKSALEDAEQELLFARIQSKNDEERQQARAELIIKYTRLIKMIARRVIAKRPSTPGVEIRDLEQEGMIALLRSADNYDRFLGVKFPNYCSGYIEECMRRYFQNHFSTVHIGRYTRRKVADLIENTQPGPNNTPTQSLQELGEILGVKADLSPSFSRESNTKITLGDIITSELIVDHMESLDGDFESGGSEYGEEGFNIIDTLNPVSVTEWSPQPSTDEKALVALTRQALLDVLDYIGGRGAEIIRLRYGLLDGKYRTLAEVAEIMGGVSGESIRQIESKTLKRIRQTEGRFYQITDLLSQ